jgi:MFS family permease
MQVKTSRLALFASLTSRPFALLWSGQTISRIGDFLYQIALVWWVLQSTGSAVAMGTVLVCSFAPMLVFLLLGGVAVDRFHRIRVMVASDLFRGILVCTLAVLALQHHLSLWHVYVASVLFGTVDAFFQPAYTAVLPQLAPEAALPSANALTSMSQQLGRIAGPALGALIVAVGGTTLAFAVDGLSFFASAACLAPLLGIAAPGQGDRDTRNIFRDIGEALYTVRAAPWLWLTIMVSALANVTLAGPYEVALPFLARTHFHASVGLLGMLYACFALGYVVSDVTIGGRGRLRHRGVLMYGGLLGAGLFLLVLGLPVPIVVAALAAVLNGVSLELFSLTWTTTLQQLVPADQLGRVSSIDLVGSYALLPVGYWLAGWATDRWGAAEVFVLGGGITVLLAIVGLAHPLIRRLD